MEVDKPQTATDKFLTVAAEKLFICQQEEHWTLKVSGWLMPANGCGCCLAFRGLTIGAIIGATIVAAPWILITIIN